MDMLGGSPQPDQYLTGPVYTVLASFRSGFGCATQQRRIPIVIHASGEGHASGNRPESLQPTEFARAAGTSRHRSGAGSQAAPALHPATRRAAAPDAIAPRSSEGMAHGAVVRTRKARYLKGERVWDAQLGCRPRALRRPTHQRWR